MKYCLATSIPNYYCYSLFFFFFSWHVKILEKPNKHIGSWIGIKMRKVRWALGSDCWFRNGFSLHATKRTMQSHDINSYVSTSYDPCAIDRDD